MTTTTTTTKFDNSKTNEKDLKNSAHKNVNIIHNSIDDPNELCDTLGLLLTIIKILLLAHFTICDEFI